jgi:MtN3 and saliva related transmembrane protein
VPFIPETFSDGLTAIIGWTSSVVLLLTVAQQVWKQWQEGATEGISRWLFVGQLAASAGFTAYSLMKRDWVFVSTNGLMVVNALLGCWILRRNKRRHARTRQ